MLKGLLETPGPASLCRDLELPQTGVNAASSESFFTVFRDAVRARIQEMRGGVEIQPLAVPRPAQEPLEPPLKSLKDRIDEAHADPRFPAQVLAVIDKNRLNTVGHSGSKYSELLETLLAVPWGRIEPIRVPPEVFEEGLHRTHYGLQRPKELLCDFFTNLIWRYQLYAPEQAARWRQTGSAFLLVGPPGVGKTSLAISVAQNLGIPYHKISLGGMRDEADIRGHGFTYEGSKPGFIVQGLIKMGVMNGLFILDEADKTEKFAIATLLEILDPEQNHLFHDKYTETTVDIDLSNCHFFLTANTLETVPAVVVNRCEVVQLDRYSVEEKVAIAREHLIRRVRYKYQIDERQILFEPETEVDILRYLIRDYTYEAGVRELERLIRTLFLRIQRKEIITGGASVEAGIVIRRETIKRYLKEPTRPRQIGEDDRVGETIALGVDVERGVGSIIPIQATSVGAERGATPGAKGYLSIVHATGNIEKVMDESRKVAATGIFQCAGELGIDQRPMEEPVHLHFMGASTRKDGPSAGGAIALALASLASAKRIRRDIAMTGEIDTKGRITAVGGLAAKLEAASSAGCRTVIIPRENLYGDEGIERFPDALKAELQILTVEEWMGAHEPFDYTRHMLQVVAVDHIVQAVRVAFLDETVLAALDRAFEDHAHRVADALRQPAPPCLCLQVIQVKAVEELDAAFFDEEFWTHGPDLTLLVQPEIEGLVKARLSGVVPSVQERVRPFDPARESLSDVTRALLAGHRVGATGPIRVSLVAPYYFIKRDGITEDTFPPRPGFEGITLFANNYSVQDLKIKGCKRVLNRVFSLLARIPRQISGSCPFLGRRDDIYVADLGFILEPYRLDGRRAERILTQSLGHWLSVAENSRADAGMEKGELP
ncbi:MAG: S16 family serine protease [Syntrophobacteraceae bacterium]